ncbi:MAG TPA: TonB-dependent receptor [Nevskiaceae bacterium]|nr:TonB-dependent receptor [Nevskiaceae bacterium]
MKRTLLTVALLISTPALAQEEAPPPASQPAPEEQQAPPAEQAPPASSDGAPQPYPQTVPVPPPAEPKPEVAKDAPKAQLSEVVVTATKREQSMRKIPATINVIKGEDLENMGARELEDYLKLIPGITMQEGDTNQSRAIAIRGIAPQPNGNVTTGVLVDDVAMSDPYASYLVPDLDPFDLKDLEVLKGPQGTLFGAGALNGAIRYVLNKPKLGVTEGRLFANYLTLEPNGGAGVNYGGAINVPLGETFALRAVGMKQTLPGLYDDVNANGKNDIDADRGDKNMWRVLAQWKPIEAFTANAFFLKQHNNRDDLSVANSPNGPPPNGEFIRTDTPGPSTAVQEFEIANLDLRYDFDWFTLISETSRSKKFQDINYDGSAVADPAAEQGVQSLRLHIHAHTLALSEELRLASPASSDSNWVWLVGGYYNKYTAHFFLNAPVANTAILAPILGPGGLIPNLPIALPINLVPNGDGLSAQNIRYEPLQATEMSLFGELTRKLFDKQVEATLGARLYKERLYGQPVLEGGTAPYGNLIHYADAQNMYAKGFNPKASLKWQATKDLLFYSTVARGFQFGGINVPAPLPSDNTYPLSYKPSTIWSYEIGTRTDWLAHTLQADATVFYIDWTDMQLRQDTQSGNTDYVSNVGKARSMGVESAIRWLTPIPGLMLTNNTSYIRATVQKEYTTSDGDDIPKGQELPASPHVQTSTQLAYKLFFSAFSVAPSVTFSYIGGAWSNVQHETRIFGYGVLDAGLTFMAPQWPMQPEIGVSGSNLLDRRAYNGARFLHVGDTTIDELVNYNKPRAITARVMLRF